MVDLDYTFIFIALVCIYLVADSGNIARKIQNFIRYENRNRKKRMA